MSTPKYTPRSVAEYRRWWAESTDIPYGFCQCGCGQKTPTWSKTDSSRKRFKGEPMRYFKGHNNRKDISKADYTIEDRGHDTPCWIWQRYIDHKHGYGIVTVWPNPKLQLAHRVFYKLYRGHLPDDKPLDHLCRVRCCVNPQHLEIVTTAINTQRGIQSKLNPDKVRQARVLREEGMKYKDIAEVVGVAPCTISNLFAGRIWRNVHKH